LLAGGGDVQLIVMRQTSGEKTTSFQMLLSNNPLKTTSQNKPSQQTKQIKSNQNHHHKNPNPTNTQQQQQQKTLKENTTTKFTLSLLL
jgi:hypothetical protein